MIGLVSSTIGKGGRIMVPTTSRAYKGGRFLGQHGGLLKTSKGGRVLGSKTFRTLRTRASNVKPKVTSPSTVKRHPIRPHRSKVQRRRKKLPRRRSKAQSRSKIQRRRTRPASSTSDTLASTLKKSARSALKGVVRQGKKTFKSSAKQLMREVPKTLMREAPKMLAREAPRWCTRHYLESGLGNRMKRLPCQRSVDVYLYPLRRAIWQELSNTEGHDYFNHDFRSV